MQTGRASQTAAWVATARSLGSLLPDELVLARDAYGVSFGSARLRMLAQGLTLTPRLSRSLLLRAGPLTSLVLWMQLRTRALDDLARAYLTRGGKQIVLLGAGFDCRALRLMDRATDAKVYEIDHPATQARKRQVLGAHAAPCVRYLPFDFEHDALSNLPRKLGELGFDARASTLTLWEGVTMYLSEQAIADSVEAVRSFSGQGSTLAFNYIDNDALKRPALGLKAITHVVKRAGEPYQFGWHPEGLGAWLNARGFELTRDVSEHELALQYWPHRAVRNTRAGRRIAVADTID